MKHSPNSFWRKVCTNVALPPQISSESLPGQHRHQSFRWIIACNNTAFTTYRQCRFCRCCCGLNNQEKQKKRGDSEIMFSHDPLPKNKAYLRKDKLKSSTASTTLLSCCLSGRVALCRPDHSGVTFSTVLRHK